MELLTKFAMCCCHRSYGSAWVLLIFNLGVPVHRIDHWRIQAGIGVSHFMDIPKQKPDCIPNRGMLNFCELHPFLTWWFLKIGEPSNHPIWINLINQPFLGSHLWRNPHRERTTIEAEALQPPPPMKTSHLDLGNGHRCGCNFQAATLLENHGDSWRPPEDQASNAYDLWVVILDLDIYESI